MTRVNVGIEPRELCDQHLLAEIRELPRCYSYRTDAGPWEFTLGKGHVLWCARYFGSLHTRHMGLWAEALFRGFNVRMPPSPQRLTSDNAGRWSISDAWHARPLLRERISLRLSQMIRVPKWTKRERPAWTLPNLKALP